jgi:CRISPR-associated protein Cas5d
MYNQVEFKVYGRLALFTDPITRVGGEKSSYPVPTYEALKGITESIYWKPEFTWFIDQVRVMSPIRHVAKNMTLFRDGTKDGEKLHPDLAVYTYLRNVEYRVKAHFVVKDAPNDSGINNKHYQMALRMIHRGGRRDVFLGTRECQAYVEPCSFNEGTGAYDHIENLSFGVMFHSFGYPDAKGEGKFVSRFWRAKMIGGIIDFPNPGDHNLIIKDLSQINRKVNNSIGQLCGDLFESEL